MARLRFEPLTIEPWQQRRRQAIREFNIAQERGLERARIKREARERKTEAEEEAIRVGRVRARVAGIEVEEPEFRKMTGITRPEYRRKLISRYETALGKEAKFQKEYKETKAAVERLGKELRARKERREREARKPTKPTETETQRKAEARRIADRRWGKTWDYLRVSVDPTYPKTGDEWLEKWEEEYSSALGEEVREEVPEEPRAPRKPGRPTVIYSLDDQATTDINQFMAWISDPETANRVKVFGKSKLAKALEDGIMTKKEFDSLPLEVRMDLPTPFKPGGRRFGVEQFGGAVGRYAPRARVSPIRERAIPPEKTRLQRFGERITPWAVRGERTGRDIEGIAERHGF